MRSCVSFVTLAIALFLSFSGAAQGEILHGTATLLPWWMPGCACGWDQAEDFSIQTIVSKSSPGANLAFQFKAQNGAPVWTPLHAIKLFYLDQTIESLETVPETGTVHSAIEPTGTFVMETDESWWVKFTVRGSTGTDVIFEYYVQSDGTRYFGPVLATEQSTWGHVKALYRN